MATVQLKREFSLHFGHRFLGGVRHEEVLNALEGEIEIKNIKSIQITEKDCIITLSDQDSKQKLLRVGISIKEKFVRLFGVEKEITNVTLKDAPFEMSDEVIVGFLSKYGDIVPGSVRHGYIKYKETQIDNGTRYLQILNCVPNLPTSTHFGTFAVRLYADNGRTPCSYCGLTDHPSYKCNVKQQAQKKCYICKKEGHLKRDCPEKKERVCYNCNEPGHLQRECPNWDDTDTEDEREHFSRPAKTYHATPNEIACIEDSVNIVLGASNCKRCKFEEEIINTSVSGAGYSDPSLLISDAKSKCGEDRAVKKVVVCLGTNDVSRNKSNVDKVNLSITKSIESIKNHFPNAGVGVCTVIPRKGNSASTKELNSATSAVNTFIRTMCEGDEQLNLIDLYPLFMAGNAVKMNLYDQNDASGVHVSYEGARCLQDAFNAFFAGRKRPRGGVSTSSTPSPVVRLGKKHCVSGGDSDPY